MDKDNVLPILNIGGTLSLSMNIPSMYYSTQNGGSECTGVFTIYRWQKWRGQGRGGIGTNCTLLPPSYVHTSLFLKSYFSSAYCNV